MIPIQLTDILARLGHISELWRSDTAAEQRTDLADLDAPQHPHRQRREGPPPRSTCVSFNTVEAERIDELRGRIEILMDEIEISLGIEPPAFFSPEDLDNGPWRPHSARHTEWMCSVRVPHRPTYARWFPLPEGVPGPGGVPCG